MRQRGRVARVLKLAKHLAVGKDLSRVAATQIEQAAEQRRLVHTSKQQHIASERGLDQGVAHHDILDFEIIHVASNHTFTFSAIGFLFQSRRSNNDDCGETER